MGRLIRQNGLCALAFSLVGVLVAWLGLEEFAWNDYGIEAASSVHELIRSNFEGFLLHAPAYGGSLLVRAPFALAANLWGGGELADYRMLAFPCLVAAGCLGVWLTNRLRANGRSMLAGGSLIVVLMANPVLLYALEIGHAEEILVGVLCVAAALTAFSDRSITTGVLLGLAIATKSSALVALAPVLLALPSQHRRAILATCVTAGSVLAPFFIVQHLNGKGGAGITVTGTGIIFQPQQLWWFLGDSHRIVHNSHGTVMAGYRAAPGWVSVIAHPLIIVLSGALTLPLLFRRERTPARLLALLTLVLFARCLLDPWNNLYYSLPFLFALAAWEVIARRQPPLLALLASGLMWLCFREIPSYADPDVLAACYLIWAVPAFATMACWLYAPNAFARIHDRLSGLSKQNAIELGGAGSPLTGRQ
jgi:hypothetical protein